MPKSNRRKRAGQKIEKPRLSEKEWIVEYTIVENSRVLRFYPWTRGAFSFEHALVMMREGANERAALERNGARFHAHWRIRNQWTGEVIPAEALGL